MTQDRPHDALLTFEYPSVERARRVRRAIEPEVGDIEDDRSQVRLAQENNCLEIYVSADDLVALRASLNTWQSLVTVAEQAGDAC